MFQMPRDQQSISENWYRDSFDSLYPVIYAHRTVEAARAEVEFSIARALIGKSDRVLDLCCGHGRHMAHLVKAADSVVGFDFSATLLGRARNSLGAAVQLVRGDMRTLPFQNAFDAVLNFFTSFGYFLSEAENLSVVKSIARSLRPGGRFFIDYINRDYTEDNLETTTVRHHKEYEIHERRWIDWDDSRIKKTTRVLKDGKIESETGESVQLYSPEAFTGLLEEGGLRVESLFGDYTGSDCTSSQPRMIAVGRKA